MFAAVDSLAANSLGLLGRVAADAGLLDNRLEGVGAGPARLRMELEAVATRWRRRRRRTAHV